MNQEDIPIDAGATKMPQDCDCVGSCQLISGSALPLPPGVMCKNQPPAQSAMPNAT